MKKAIVLVAIAAGLSLSSAAEAQTLSIQCKKTSSTDVVCRGLFSDGQMTPAMTVQIYDSNEKLLKTGKTDIKGEYAFKAPAPEYYVVIQFSKAEVASMSSEDIW